MKTKNNMNIQQIKNGLLILAMSSLVVACGSSSKQGTKAPETNNPKAVFSTKYSKEENIIIADKKGHKIKTDAEKDLLIVDGVKISLDDAVDEVGGKQAGIVMHYDPKTHKTLFISIGVEPTADMPKKGNATYKGEAIDYAKSAKARASVRLPVNFNVNFDKKKLMGTIGKDTHGNVIIEADIKGNTFSGKHTFNANPKKTISAKGSTHVEGRFYGKGASEMSGAYSREGIYKHGDAKVSLDTHGVFHAAKQ